MGNDNTFVHMLKLFLDMVHKSEHTILTTNGEGEHGAATARRKLEPDGGTPNKYEHGKPQAHGSGKARDGRKRGDGEDRPQRDGGAEKRVRSVQDETSTDKDGGRADQQGPRLRHRDRAVKRDE